MSVEYNLAEMRNHEIVVAAAADLEKAEGHLVRGRQVLEDAKAAQQAAFDSSRAKILSAATGGDFDPLADADEYSKATIKAEFCAKMLDEIETNVVKARAAHHQAEAESWRPVHEKGKDLRLAAALAAERARSDMEAAAALWRQGTNLVQAAHANGLPRLFDGQHLGLNSPIHGRLEPASVPTVEQEKRLWKLEDGQ